MSPSSFDFYSRKTQAVFWSLVFWAVMALVGLANLVHDVGRPFPGFLASRQADGGDRWFFDINTPSWWLQGTEGENLASGMALLAVDGQPYDIHHPATLARLAEQAGPGALVTITAQTAAGPQDFRVPLRPFTWGHLLDFRLPNLLMMAALTLIAWAVYTAQPQNELNLVAAIAFVQVGAVRVLHQGVVFPVNEPLDIVLDLLVNGIVFNFIGPLCLWLALIFPRPSRWAHWGRRLNAFAWVVVVPARVGARAWVFFFGSNPVTLWITDITIAISMGLCALAVLVALARWGAESVERAPQTRWGWRARPAMFVVWLGLVVSLLPVFISILSPYAALMPLSYFVAYFDLRYLMLGLPLAMAYVILRHRTLTGDQTLATLALGLMLASVLAALSANTLYLSQDALGMTLPRPPLELALGVIFGSMALAHQLSTRSLGRLFNREAAHLADVSALSQRLMPQLSQADLPASIPALLVNDLHFARAALWLRPPNDLSAPFTLCAQAGDVPAPLPRCLPAALASDSGQPLWALTEPALPAHLAVLPSQVWDVALALQAEDHTLGWLALGRHPDDVFLVPYERNLLHVLALNIALALWANHTLLELRQTPRRLAEVQDRERLRLAQDLHDSIQQFLGRLPFQLEISRNLMRADPPQAERVLARCLDDVHQAARTVRQIRHDLVPLGLERAFAATLTDLVGRFQAETQLNVHLHLDADLEHGLPLEARQAIYWVVKQALDNVAAHAAASQVEVRCGRDPERVWVEIGDNGRGFGPAERETARARDRFGLQVMQGRLALLGGQLTVDSHPGQGTWVRGWLPL